MKKCEPTTDNTMFSLCDSAAVPMCLSVKALKHHILRAANNDYSVGGVNGFTTSS